MKPKLLILLFTLIAIGCTRAQDESDARATLDKLISATSTRDYDGFVAFGTDEFKAKFPKSQFDASCAMLDPIFARDHEITFLGEMNQHGFKVYLFRLRFKSGGDDLLGTLSLKDGQVGGIWFH